MIWRELFELRKVWPITVIHGGARGADQIAGEFAEFYHCAVEEYPAQWQTYGKRAGFVRNRQMLEEGKPEIVLAFYSGSERSKGTAMMVDISRQAGVEVVEIFS